MANENQNTGPGLTGNDKQIREIQSATSEALRSQGDFNNLVKESQNLLKKVVTAYDNIEARIGSLNRGTINIKQINQEVLKAKQKELIVAKKLEESAKDVNAENNDGIKEYLRNLNFLKNAREEDRDLLLDQSKTLFSQLNVEEQRYINLKAANDLNEQAVKYANDKLESEKNLNSNIGLSGRLLGIIGKKLGANNDIYEDMVENARELDKVGAKLTFLDKLGFLAKSVGSGIKQAITDPLVVTAAVAATINKAFKSFVDIAKSGLDSLTGSGGPVSKFVSPFTGLIKQLPVVGGLIGGLVDAFANLVDLSISFTSNIQAFGRNLGLSFGQAKNITDEFARFAVASGQAFLSVEKLQKSQTELSTALGINNVLNNKILADNLQLQEQVGLELETRKQLAQITLISGQYQTQIFKSVVGQVEAIRRSIGVNLRAQDVIAKISQLSGVVGLTFAKYPERLAKSLAITKALGTDFQKLDSIASGLLDFESSIAAEFEAQLLTNKDINLAKARQLALDGDLTGLAVELTKQIGTSQEFLNMNRISQEAYAKAVGMSRDELADMLRQQELFAAAGAVDLKTFKERIVQMERAGTLQSQFLSKLTEEQAQLYLNSTATERIANFFDKIKQSFATLINSDQFQTFLNKFLNTLSDPNFLTSIINKLTGFVSMMLKTLSYVVDVADVVGNVFSFGSVDIPNSVPEGIRAYANSVGGMSIGGKVAGSQLATSTGAGVSTGASVMTSGGSQAINLTVQTVVDDHARKAEQRISLAPKADYTTGAYGKK